MTRLHAARALGLAAAIAAVWAACPKAWRPTDRIFVLAAPPTPWRAYQSELIVRDVGGLSGLTVAPDGMMWTICERDPWLFRVARSGNALAISGPPMPLDGFPDVLDAESLAWVGKNRVAVGAEAKARRSRDPIFLADIGPERAVVRDRIELSYKPWDMEASTNRGIEALCATEKSLVAGVETVFERGKKRYAPVARYDFATLSWANYSLRLESADGKLSAMACRSRPGDPKWIDVLAIERHFEVSRVISFALPAEGGGETPADIESVEIVIDLRAIYSGELPNFEGLSWLENGDLALVADSQSGIELGPTVALLLTRGSTAAARPPGSNLAEPEPTGRGASTSASDL